MKVFTVLLLYHILIITSIKQLSCSLIPLVTQQLHSGYSFSHLSSLFTGDVWQPVSNMAALAMVNYSVANGC